jgi:hypothetical protein
MTKNEKKKRGPTLQANISAGINTVVGLGILVGVTSDTTNPTDVPWWSFIVVPVIAILLGKLADFGTAIFKLVTPQKDFIKKSRFDLLLIEWAIIFGLPAVITFFIAMWLSGIFTI